MATCALCGRKPQFGHNVSHSNLKTKRRWNLNVQKRTLLVEGQRRRAFICTRCLKTLHKGK